MALIRVALGAALLLRGVAFLNNLPNMERLIDANSLTQYKDLLMNSIPWIHIGGGFLIILGLFTRFAAFIQIPVLLGALFFVTTKNGLFTAETDLTLSIILLLLLVIFVIEGSGPLSLASYFKEAEEEQTAAAE
ncbi:MAG: DoxX family protein [Chitinophagaceae bacterium]|nr:DoxX family protein [Chitinophagaceae bacterium]